MISRRLSALALFLLAASGCHEDPTVVSVAVQPAVTALAVSCGGGTASSTSGVDGVGGAGGQFQVVSSGLVSVGSPTFVPAAPAIPAPPSTFALTPTTPLLNTPSPFNGNILITGSVTTDTTTPIVVKTDNGDIVVDGLLQSGDTGAAQADIQLLAPNGTVFILGSVRTAGTDAASNGRKGGNLTINAARVVITGSIDTHGIANTTVAGANGGAGGTVSITSTFGPILFTSGFIFSSGGAATDTIMTNSVQGGAGGAVTLTSANQLAVFAPITGDGGAVTGNGTTPTGGAGAAITLTGSPEIDVVSTLSAVGGAATGNGADAIGGAGGGITANGNADLKYYGSSILGGGGAFATGTGGSLTGGLGGSLTFNGGLTSVEVGQGSFSFAGGPGQLSTGVGGGVGGTVHLQSTAGDVTVGGSLSVAGGDGIGGNASGANAGKIEIFADAQFTTLSVPSLASALDAFGGAAVGTGTGGKGGTVLLQSGGSLTSGARINASGGASPAGVGGGTNQLPATGTLAAATYAVILRVATTGANVGNLSVTGDLRAQGGAVSSAGAGGAGSGIGMEIAAGTGTLTSSASMTTSGGIGVGAAAGASGPITLTNVGGDIVLSNTLTASGSSSPTFPSVGGNIAITSGGSVSGSVILTSVGGAGADPAGMVSGVKGGAITITGTGAISQINLLGGTTLQADGGSASGANIGTLGGGGGTITLTVVQQSISLSGSYLSRGGSIAGVGTGGPGGKMVVVTGAGGGITLNGDGGLDLSGGGGSLLGPAQRNAGGDPAGNPGAATLAVIFDADSGLAATGGVAGKVVNLGSITATGSTGGDVYFDGQNSLGGATPDPGVQNLSGTIIGQFYPH